MIDQTKSSDDPEKSNPASSGESDQVAATPKPQARTRTKVLHLLLRALAIGGLLASAVAGASTFAILNACLWSVVLILEFGIWLLQRRRR